MEGYIHHSPLSEALPHQTMKRQPVSRPHRPSQKAASMILLLLFLPLFSAYSSHWYPFATPKPSFLILASPRTQRYELGLGKHGPVGGNAIDYFKTEAELLEMTKYCSEFESVNAIPNPSHRLQQMQASQASVKSEDTKIKPRIQLKRYHEEDFAIRRLKNRADPVLTSPRQARDYDLNTAWVELLIHEQQQRVQLA